MRKGYSLELVLEMDEPLDQQRDQIRKWAFNGATDRECNSEIGDDRLAVLHENVLGLQVTMDDARLNDGERAYKRAVARAACVACVPRTELWNENDTRC